MNGAWSRFRSLSRADQALVIEAATLLVFVRLGTVLLSFSALRRALEGYVRLAPRLDRDSSRARVDRVAWAVSAVARRRPVRTTCLVESLAVDAMLRRRGYACALRVGVRPPCERTLAAHAWVEHQGAVVFGATEDLAEYSVLSARAHDDEHR